MSAFRRFGLAARLMVFGLLAVLLVTGLGGWLLRYQLHGTILRSAASSLDDRANRIVAGLSMGSSGRLMLDHRLVHDEFRMVFSGWYWQLEGEGMAERSRSLWDSNLPVGEARKVRGDMDLYRVMGPRGGALLGTTRDVTLAGKPFQLHVYGPGGAVARDMARIDQALLAMLGGLSLAMLLAMYVQVRLGLRPLRRLHDAVQRIHTGDRTRAGLGYGPDLDPLAAEIDEVLERNARIVTRARGNAADLSHALKKTLALLNAESVKPVVEGGFVRKQVDTMLRLIERHLSRAGSGAGDLRRIDVGECMQGLLGLMRQLHAGRNLTWELMMDPLVCWRGEVTDLEEMLGNLLDNAGKWARSRVDVSVRLHPPPTTEADGLASRTGFLEVVIADDGLGLTEEQMVRVRRRGQRLDESVEGSGLGLSIASDIAGTYDGHIELGRSVTGGLKVVLRLPS